MITDLIAFFEDLECRAKEATREGVLAKLSRDEYARLLELRGEKLIGTRRSREFLMHGQNLLAVVEHARVMAAKATIKRLLE